MSQLSKAQGNQRQEIIGKSSFRSLPKTYCGAVYCVHRARYTTSMHAGTCREQANLSYKIYIESVLNVAVRLIPLNSSGNPLQNTENVELSDP